MFSSLDVSNKVVCDVLAINGELGGSSLDCDVTPGTTFDVGKVVQALLVSQIAANSSRIALDFSIIVTAETIVSCRVSNFDSVTLRQERSKNNGLGITSDRMDTCCRKRRPG